MFNETENLLLNMSGGLRPEFLTKREVELLVVKYGDDWFKKLGYTEPEYLKPRFDTEEDFDAE